MWKIIQINKQDLQHPEQFSNKTQYTEGHLKLVTQTERIPASAAARHATETASEI